MRLQDLLEFNDTRLQLTDDLLEDKLEVFSHEKTNFNVAFRLKQTFDFESERIDHEGYIELVAFLSLSYNHTSAKGGFEMNQQNVVNLTIHECSQRDRTRFYT